MNIFCSIYAPLPHAILFLQYPGVHTRNTLIEAGKSVAAVAAVAAAVVSLSAAAMEPAASVDQLLATSTEAMMELIASGIS